MSLFSVGLFNSQKKLDLCGEVTNFLPRKKRNLRKEKPQAERNGNPMAITLFGCPFLFNAM
jgi:hypothetical protein